MSTMQGTVFGSTGAHLGGLVFDAYGTLFDVFAVTALCETLFPKRGSALAQLWRTKQLQYSTLRSLMGRYKPFWEITEDALVFAARALDLELTTAAREQLMAAYLRLAAFPDVRPGLEALKAAGLRLAILSNGSSDMLTAVARAAGVDRLLDAIISVEAVQIFKPSPLVYQLASTHLQLATPAIGFVSSNSWDVQGAASTGMTTFWIQRSATEPPEELGFAATRTVSTITELLPLIGR